MRRGGYGGGILPEHAFFLQEQKQLLQVFLQVHLHDRFACRKLIGRTEQEAYGKDTGFNGHQQPSGRAIHAAPPETTRRIRCRVSHRGRGQLGGQIQDQTIIEKDISDSRKQGSHHGRGRGIGFQRVIEKEWFVTCSDVVQGQLRIPWREGLPGGWRHAQRATAVLIRGMSAVEAPGREATTGAFGVRV